MNDPAVSVANRPMLGILYCAVAVLAFALGDTFTKYLAERQPVTFVIGSRYWMNFLLLVIFLGPVYGARMWRTDRKMLVLLRGAILACASLAMGSALRYIPVGEATSIVYLAPIMVILLAGPILGEKVQLVSVLCAMAGFLGVILIARPGSGLNPVGVGFAFLNVTFTAGYHLITRLLARTETAIAMQIFSGLVGAVILTPYCVVAAIGLHLTQTELLAFFAMGTATTIGHFLFTLAYREASSTLIAPFTYLQLFWAAGFGWLIFGHVPDGLSSLGIAMIGLSGIGIALHGRLVSRRDRKGPQAKP